MKKITFRPNNEVTEAMQRAPMPSVKFLPEWFKVLSPYRDGKREYSFEPNGGTFATVKKCIPFLDALTSGYTLTLEQDVIVENQGIEKLFSWKGGDRTVVSSHPFFQYDGFPLPSEYHELAFKWENEWSIETPAGYSLLFTHPLNRVELPFFTLAGLVDSDNYKSAVKLPFFIKKDFTGVIPAGTPIAQVFPIKRDDWVSEIVDFDSKKTLRGKYEVLTALKDFYKKAHWQKKSYK
jgi:hypothetical protein